MGQWVEGSVKLIAANEQAGASGAGAAHAAFRATNARANEILLGSTPSDPEVAATWRGVSPMEAVLLGLGGCTAIDVESTLRKMRQDVVAYTVRVRGERRDEHPRIYTHIVVEHELRGRNLRESAVRRAIELSAGRYCSVSAMLERSATVELSYLLIDAESGAETKGTVHLPAAAPAAPAPPGE